MRKYIYWLLIVTVHILVFAPGDLIHEYWLISCFISCVFGLWGFLSLRTREYWSSLGYFISDVLLLISFAWPLNSYDKICPWVSIHLCFIVYILIALYVKIRRKGYENI